LNKAESYLSFKQYFENYKMRLFGSEEPWIQRRQTSTGISEANITSFKGHRRLNIEHQLKTEKCEKQKFQIYHLMKCSKQLHFEEKYATH
jgi:hypothetical protein